MYPILYQNNWLLIPTWHFFFLLAIFSSYFYSHFLRSQFYPLSFPKEKLTELFLAIYVGGYLGARFISLLVEEKKKFPWEVLSNLITLGPMTFYGAFLGGSFLGLLYLRRKKIILIALDLGVSSTLLGLSIGRIGCFFNGDDYGIPASQLSSQEKPWWAVSFPNHAILLPRVPTQLIESLTTFLLALLLFMLLKKKRKAGVIGFLGILFYSISRFFIEFLRGDSRGTFFSSNLSTSQGISLILITVSTLILLRRNNSY